MQTINIAIVGKTGHGKSSTGNTILRKQACDESTNANDETEILTLKKAIIENYKIKVFDFPGLQPEQHSKDFFIKQVYLLMTLAPTIHLFIFVFSYACCFNSEEERVLYELQTVFGEDFLRKHGMVVVTHGDICTKKALRKKTTTEKAFKKWCDKSGGKFNTLRRMVNDRFLLVNNKGTFDKFSDRMDSSEEIHKIARNMLSNREPYTKEKFEEIQRSSSWCNII